MNERNSEISTHPRLLAAECLRQPLGRDQIRRPETTSSKSKGELMVIEFVVLPTRGGLQVVYPRRFTLAIDACQGLGNIAPREATNGKSIRFEYSLTDGRDSVYGDA